MTDPEHRAVNRAICLLGDEHQDEREEARAALHSLFRLQRKLEARVVALTNLPPDQSGSEPLGR